MSCDGIQEAATLKAGTLNWPDETRQQDFNPIFEYSEDILTYTAYLEAVHEHSGTLIQMNSDGVGVDGTLIISAGSGAYPSLITGFVAQAVMATKDAGRYNYYMTITAPGGEVSRLVKGVITLDGC